MPRPRQALEKAHKGNRFEVIFRHPVTLKTRRVVLAPETDAKLANHRLDELNAVFLDPPAWRRLPDTASDWLTRAWGQEQGIAPQRDLRGHLSEVAIEAFAVAGLPDDFYFDLEEEIRHPLYVDLDNKDDRIKALEREVTHWRGRKLQPGPSRAIGSALDKWLADYKGRDSDHYATVKSDLKRFVAHFKEQTRADAIDAKELDTWLRGLVNTKKGSKNRGKPISSKRKREIRTYVLKFLREIGSNIEPDEVPRISDAELRAGRGAIRWLEREQATAVAEKLPAYWADVFRVQVSLGLRPDELLTLHRSNFTPDLDRLTLTPRGRYTLKTGPRTIQVPAKARAIIKARLEISEIVFPKPPVTATKKKPAQATGGDWGTVIWFNRAYRRALRKAGTAAGVGFVMDCRVPRRTCASLLLRSGMSYAEVAAVLGDRPDTIRAHYAALVPSEVNPKAAEL